MPAGEEQLDVVVVGGGQAALACGWALARRTRRSSVLLDAAERPGGAWGTRWDSLELFSPAEHSSLPGWPMPAPEGGGLPGRAHVVDYLTAYERRYGLRVERPVAVVRVERDGDGLVSSSADGRRWRSRAVISATGLRPWTPALPGAERFEGRRLHAADYRAPGELAGARVLVVGAGNSGAQLVAELSAHAEVTWVSPDPPAYLPDDVDGRVLFARATARHARLEAGEDAEAPRGLGSIVVVPAVRAARERGALVRRPMVDHLVPRGAVWPDGAFAPFDVVLWATGYRPALEHLAPLGVLEGEDADPPVAVAGARATREPRLWLVGYGDWTGFASATVIGVGRAARSAVEELDRALG